MVTKIWCRKLRRPILPVLAARDHIIVIIHIANYYYKLEWYTFNLLVTLITFFGHQN